MKLTPHFSYEELIKSEYAARHGIDNTPTQRIVENLQFLAERLEEVRELLGGVPITITSGFRSERLNAAIGGSLTSQHRYGLAADFIAPSFGTPYDVARHLAAKMPEKYDQLIHEFGQWVHISFVRNNPRREPITTFDGKKYVPGILTRELWERRA